MTDTAWINEMTADDISCLASRIIGGAFRDLTYSQTALRSLRRINRIRHRSECMRRAREAYQDTADDIEFFRSDRSDLYFSVLDLDNDAITAIKQTYITRALPTLEALEREIDRVLRRRESAKAA